MEKGERKDGRDSCSPLFPLISAFSEWFPSQKMNSTCNQQNSNLLISHGSRLWLCDYRHTHMAVYYLSCPPLILPLVVCRTLEHLDHKLKNPFRISNPWSLISNQVITCSQQHPHYSPLCIPPSLLCFLPRFSPSSHSSLSYCTITVICKHVVNLYIFFYVFLSFAPSAVCDCKKLSKSY